MTTPTPEQWAREFLERACQLNHPSRFNAMLSELTDIITKADERDKFQAMAQFAGSIRQGLEVERDSFRAKAEALDWLEAQVLYRPEIFINASGTVTVYTTQPDCDANFSQGFGPTILSAIQQARLNTPESSAG